MSSHKSLFNKSVNKKPKLDNEEKQDETTLERQNKTNTNNVKKPAFNPALLNSAFYTGPIQYGGAGLNSSVNQYTSQYTNSKFYDKKKIDVKVIPSKTQNTVGQIAKTICECLETYSSPISDAKRVPINNRPPVNSYGTTFNNLSIFDTSRRSLTNDSLTPSRPHRSRELQIPTIAALSKIKKTNRCSNARAAIMASMSSSLPLEPKSYKVRSEEDNTSTYKNKMKTKINTVRGAKNDEEEMAQPVHLQNISLNITSLPTFSETPFPIAHKYMAPDKEPTPPVSNVSIQNNFKFTNPTSAKEPEPSKSLMKFKFSEPVDIFDPKHIDKLAKTEFEKVRTESGTGISGNLKFSKPDSPSSIFTNFKSGDTKPTPETNVSPKTLKYPWNGIDNTKTFEKSLVNGDIAHSTGKRSHSDAVSESVLVDSDENANIKKVKADLPAGNSSTLESFIKKQQQQWECSSCMTRNDQSKDKCVCCEAPKPGATEQSKEKYGRYEEPRFDDFMKKQQKQWESPSFMTTNEQSKEKFVPCEVRQPKFDDIIKKQQEQWECSSCMARNDKSKDKCVCCETPKPGGSSESTPVTQSKESSTPIQFGFGNIIKKQQQQWECPCCMIRNDQNRNKCASCEAAKPGSEPSNAAATKFNFGNPQNTFKFGIDKAAESTKSTFTAPPSSIAKTLETSAPVTGFTFGNPTSVDSKTANGNVGGFKFGVPSSATTTTESTSAAAKPSFSFNEKKESTPAPAPGGFTFGVKPSEVATSSGSLEPSTNSFTFSSIPKKDSEITTKDTASIVPKVDNSKIVNSPQTQKAETSSTTSSNAVSSDSKPLFTFNTPAKNEFPASKPFQFGTTPASSIPPATSTDTFTPNKPFLFGQNASEIKSEVPVKSGFQMPPTPGSLFSPANSTPSQGTENKIPAALPSVQFASNPSAEKPKDQPPPSFFSFGSAASSASSPSSTFKSPVSNVPAFSFGSSNLNKPEASSMFNTPTTTSPPASLFGSKPSVETTATNPLFKSAVNIFKSASDGPSTANVFGSSTLNPPGAKPPAVLFGASPLTSEPSTQPTQNTSSPFSNANVPSFGSSGNIFGSTASTAGGNTVSGNVFGQSISKPGESSVGLFNLQQPAPPLFPSSLPPTATPPQASNAIFGSSPSVPTPVFGASIPFGEANQNQAQQNVSFKFASQNSTQPTAMGFNQAPAAGSSAPVFSFGAGPAPTNSQFNFSMGAPSSAFSTPGIPGARRIKKAVRRSNVR